MLVLAAALGTLVSAQSSSPASVSTQSPYRDLVQVESGTYGVDVRGTADPAAVEARVGPDTSIEDRFKAARLAANSRQSLVVKWSARDVSVNIGGRSINYRASWKTGNAVRVSARGDARVTIAKAGGRRVNLSAAGSPAPGGTSDLVLTGAHLTGEWTIEGTIDWPDEPGTEDAVFVTAGQQEPAAGSDDRRPRLFTGGVADPFVFRAPDGTQRVSLTAGVTRTWTGEAGSNWNNPGNWTPPPGVPASGDVLTFETTGNVTSTVNDLPDIQLGGLRVLKGNYEIGGAGLRLAAGSQSELQSNLIVSDLLGAGTIAFANQTSLTVAAETDRSIFSGTLQGSRLAPGWYVRLTVDPSARMLIDCLERQGRHLARADYWIAYRLTFLAREVVIVAPDREQDRYPPYRRPWMPVVLPCESIPSRTLRPRRVRTERRPRSARPPCSGHSCSEDRPRPHDIRLDPLAPLEALCKRRGRPATRCARVRGQLLAAAGV